MEIKQAVKILKSKVSLTEAQLDFLDMMCYIKTSTWQGDVNECLRAEAKREIALTLRTFKEMSEEDLVKLYKANGDDEWLNKAMQELQE